MSKQAVIRPVEKRDLRRVCEIWNEVVLAANAFPGDEALDQAQMEQFLKEQTLACCAEEDGEVLGVYILHPNNIGRCGHISNASYAVKSSLRGMHIGRLLVSDCLKNAKRLGFKILQFNAVVDSNKAALHLYEKLGFTHLGVIPGGFWDKTGAYQDIHLFYIQTP